MQAQNVFFQRGALVRQEFEAHAELSGGFGDALPPIMRGDRPFDLHANRETALDRAGRDPIRVGAEGDGGPGEQHGAKLCAGAVGASWNSPLTHPNPKCVLTGFISLLAMRDDYIKEALKTVPDPNILINVVSRRVKQLRRGNRPLVESLEKLSPEDTALREVIEGKISHELATS